MMRGINQSLGGLTNVDVYLSGAAQKNARRWDTRTTPHVRASSPLRRCGGLRLRGPAAGPRSLSTIYDNPQFAWSSEDAWATMRNKSGRSEG